ncbi:hypothetical protein Dimus_004288 [Dionaea muscipula]
MANPSELIQHIESFVDSTRSPSQQPASVDAVATLVQNDVFTMEELAREMEMYLTTTDNILRARGILFLAEVLAALASKPLDTATIHSLIGFFSERLSDWRALRGALVGCLALIRRKIKVGRVTGNDARALAESYLQNLEVQSLGQHDRKLCFELLECLMDRYPGEIAALGDHLVYGVCQAIDGEKDPQCLMLTFRIVEVLAGLFPDPSGPLVNVAEDIFDILGCYFPIHYSHPKSEDVDVSRGKLSMALMLAFSSTPFFEPFAIPLLLEKLSSSLPLAKVDSLKYLSCCTNTYGPERIGKHAEAIWVSLKSAIRYSAEDHVLPFAFDSTDSMGFQENEIMKEAFVLLQTVVLQPDNVFLDVILQDTEINGVVNSIDDFRDYDNIPLESKHKLVEVGHVLSIMAKASSASCNRVFETFFLRLLDTLGVARNGSVGDSLSIDASSVKLNFGALYLVIQIIAACRDLAVTSVVTASYFALENNTWFQMVNSFYRWLVKWFDSIMMRSVDEKHLGPASLLGVKGLEVLATFPEGSLPISKLIFENILVILVSSITMNFRVISLWNAALKALVCIGSFVDSYQDKEKSSCFLDIVVRRILLLLQRNNCSMPLSLVLEAISNISTTGRTSTVTTAQVMEETIAAKLSEVFVAGDYRLTGHLVQLLECYSSKLLPRLHELGDFEEDVFLFAVDICEQIEKSATIDFSIKSKELLSATMVALKLAVASCSEEKQFIIVEKAFKVFSSNESFLHMQSIPLRLGGNLVGGTLAFRNEWILSVFSAIVIALRPKTTIPNVKAVVQTLMGGILKGHAPAAQALGSVVNKMHKGTEMGNASSFYLEDILEIVFKVRLWSSGDNVSLRSHGYGENGDMCRNETENVLQIHWIIGLAWIGKGLLMRGHEKVKDVTMILLQCLLLIGEMRGPPLQPGPIDEGNVAHMLPLMRSAADAFHIMMSDSEDCLDRRFHANVRPLYKQRLFSTLTPILLTSLTRCQLSVTRSMLYRAFGHIISDAPLIAVLGEMKKLVCVLLDALPVLSQDVLNKDMVYNLLLVLSAFLTDRSGQEVIGENAHFIVNCLTQLVSYPHMMLVRETAIQCLIAMSGVTHARIYPMRMQVLRAVSKVLDDPKRAVRREAVRCLQSWRSIA